jgi:hypothetical protein
LRSTLTIFGEVAGRGDPLPRLPVVLLVAFRLPLDFALEVAGFFVEPPDLPLAATAFFELPRLEVVDDLDLPAVALADVPRVEVALDREDLPPVAVSPLPRSARVDLAPLEPRLGLSPLDAFFAAGADVDLPCAPLAERDDPVVLLELALLLRLLAGRAVAFFFAEVELVLRPPAESLFFAETLDLLFAPPLLEAVFRLLPPDFAAREPSPEEVFLRREERSALRIASINSSLRMACQPATPIDLAVSAKSRRVWVFRSASVINVGPFDSI